jgi:DNA-binding NtrC family response regulator
LVEACLLRGWPGNIRELQAEVSTAALTARANSDQRVKAEHLRPGAGAPMQQVPSVSPALLAPVPAISASAGTPLPMDAAVAAGADPPPAGSAREADSEPQGQPIATSPPSRAHILAALIDSKGNISAAARAVRVHRTQFRRLLARYNIDLEKLRAMEKL